MSRLVNQYWICDEVDITKWEVLCQEAKPTALARADEIDRLGKYLMEKFPNEIGKEALGHGRGIVDVAIRLLDKFKIIDT